MLTNKKIQSIRKEQGDSNRYWKKEVEKERKLYYNDSDKYWRDAERETNEIKNYLNKLKLSRKGKNIQRIRLMLIKKYGFEVGDSIPVSWIKNYKDETKN